MDKFKDIDFNDDIDIDLDDLGLDGQAIDLDNLSQEEMEELGINLELDEVDLSDFELDEDLEDSEEIDLGDLELDEDFDLEDDIELEEDFEQGILRNE